MVHVTVLGLAGLEDRSEDKKAVRVGYEIRVSDGKQERTIIRSASDFDALAAALKTRSPLNSAQRLSLSERPADGDKLRVLTESWLRKSVLAVPRNAAHDATIRFLALTSLSTKEFAPPVILVIAPLPLEKQAVINAFDDVFNGRDADMVLGRIGRHNLLVVSLSSMGDVSAALRVKEILELYPSIDQVLVCGIAGAVPRAKSAASHPRLGDVCVSDRAGVTQLGASMNNVGSFKPDEKVVGVAKQVLAPASAPARLALQRAIARNVALDATASRPADNTDPGFHDASGRAVSHPKRPKNLVGVSNVLFGNIGVVTGEVLRDAKLRDAYAKDSRLVCIEMESWGVATACSQEKVGFIVVRGLCDYCDSGKAKHWQPHAAAAAAAAMRLVVRAMPPPTSSRSRSRAGSKSGGDVRRPVLFWGVNPRNPSFVGRHNLLGTLDKPGELYQLLCKPDAGVIMGVGQGGMGKSQLALEYAHRFAPLYRSSQFDVLVWWIDAETLHTTELAFKEFAPQIGVSVAGNTAEGVRDMVKNKLSNIGSWLIVFDNVDRPEGEQETTAFFPVRQNPARQHILVTSRNNLWQRATRIQVDVFSDDDCVQMLYRQQLHPTDAALAPKPVTPEQQQLAIALGDRLGRLPLAVALAAQNIREEDATVLEYLTELDELEAVVGDHHDELPEPLRKVGATIDKSLRDLKKFHKDRPAVYAAAIKVLDHAAYLAPDAMPRELLMSAGSVGRKGLAGLRTFSLVSLDREPNRVSLPKLVMGLMQQPDQRRSSGSSGRRRRSSGSSGKRHVRVPSADLRRLKSNVLSQPRHVDIAADDDRPQPVWIHRLIQELTYRRHSDADRVRIVTELCDAIVPLCLGYIKDARAPQLLSQVLPHIAALHRWCSKDLPARAPQLQLLSEASNNLVWLIVMLAEMPATLRKRVDKEIETMKQRGASYLPSFASFCRDLVGQLRRDLSSAQLAPDRNTDAVDDEDDSGGRSDNDDDIDEDDNDEEEGGEEEEDEMEEMEEDLEGLKPIKSQPKREAAPPQPKPKKPQPKREAAPPQPKPKIPQPKREAAPPQPKPPQPGRGKVFTFEEKLVVESSPPQQLPTGEQQADLRAASAKPLATPIPQPPRPPTGYGNAAPAPASDHGNARTAPASGYYDRGSDVLASDYGNASTAPASGFGNASTAPRGASDRQRDRSKNRRQKTSANRVRSRK